MSKNHIFVYCAANMDSFDELRQEIQTAIKDPGYSIMTNYDLSVVSIAPGAIVIAEDADAEQLDWLRGELVKANEDPSYIVIAPFNIHTLGFNRG